MFEQYDVTLRVLYGKTQTLRLYEASEEGARLEALRILEKTNQIKESQFDMVAFLSTKKVIKEILH